MNTLPHRHITAVINPLLALTLAGIAIGGAILTWEWRATHLSAVKNSESSAGHHHHHAKSHHLANAGIAKG